MGTESRLVAGRAGGVGSAERDLRGGGLCHTLPSYHPGALTAQREATIWVHLSCVGQREDRTPLGTTNVASSILFMKSELLVKPASSHNLVSDDLQFPECTQLFPSSEFLQMLIPLPVLLFPALGWLLLVGESPVVVHTSITSASQHLGSSPSHTLQHCFPQELPTSNSYMLFCLSMTFHLFHHGRSTSVYKAEFSSARRP